MPISSNITESQGNDPYVFHSSGNAPLNSIASAHGNALSSSNTLLIIRNNDNAPNTPNNENAPDSNGNAALPAP